MKKIRVLIGLLLVGIILFKGVTFYQTGTFHLKGKRMYSESDILVDETGKTIASKQKNKKIAPASLAKMMTAIIALEKLPDINTTTLVDSQQTNQLLAQDASMAGFTPGSTVTVRQLLYGLMLPSGADAAVSLAMTASGSEEQFVQEMNQKAADLGMTNSHFTNPYGTSDDEQYATVSDLAKLLTYALENGHFRAIFTSPVFQDDSYLFYSSTFNAFGDPQLKNGYLLGGKTGFTDEAGLCLASLAEVRGKEYILITVGADGDHHTEPFHTIDARHIYDSL